MASVNNNTMARAATVALTDLAKVEGELPADDAEALALAVKPFFSKELDEAVAKIEGEHSAAAEQIAKLQSDNEALVKTVGDLTETMRKLNARVEELADMPMPAKAATSRTAHAGPVSKGDDGSGRHDAQMSEADVIKVLSVVQSLPEDKRNLLMMKAAQSKPVAVRGVS